MPTAADYFIVLSKNAKHDYDAWRLTSERTGSAESRKAKLRATLKFFDQEGKLDGLSQEMNSIPDKTDLSPQLCGLIDQLVSDLAEYVRPEELNVFRETHIGLLPLGSVDGLCLDKTLLGEQLDGFLVILNEGLWVCAQLLAKAFVLENLDGDFKDFRRTGRHDFEVAIHHYLSPSGKNANCVFFENTTPEVEGELAAAQSMMATLIMQFVVLHEFGHILNRDLELMGEYRFHISQTSKKPVFPTQTYWDLENAADEYSLRTICRHSRTDINRWANFITIYIFFHWLASVENVSGRTLCPMHPPPATRGKRLLNWMWAHYPPDREALHYIERTKTILDSWSKGR